MKYNCEIISDILPLYVEEMVSKKSTDMIIEHLAECEECRNKLEEMGKIELNIQHNKDMAESFKRYERKRNRRIGWRVGLGTLLGLLLVMLLIASPFIYDILNIEVYTDVENYKTYIGSTADMKYKVGRGYEGQIFPAAITENMNVLDFQMVYYNPCDKQNLCHFVVAYEEEAYQLERSRLMEYGSSEYFGIYGVEGFHQKYELLAIYVDGDRGFIYALDAGNQEIIYVQILFGNLFMDLDYRDYIKEEYLPLGFDASIDNPYRMEWLERIEAR